jgi:hypothetical protein
MRLLQVDQNGEFSLTDDLIGNIPPYAILSHTWAEDHEEVNFKDLTIGPRKTKTGYKKLCFCAERAARDGLQHFWVDTCSIDKSNNADLSEDSLCDAVNKPRKMATDMFGLTPAALIRPT